MLSLKCRKNTKNTSVAKTKKKKERKKTKENLCFYQNVKCMIDSK